MVLAIITIIIIGQIITEQENIIEGMIITIGLQKEDKLVQELL